MANERKRLPGEPNPEARSDGPDRVVQQAQLTGGMGSRPMSGGTGNGDLGIVRGILALVDWYKQRKASKSRSPE
jgi:hypothetical protein